MQPTADMKAVAHALVSSDLRSLGISDVYAWRHGGRGDKDVYALVGDALKLKLKWLQHIHPNHHNSFDLALQRQLGLPAERRRGFPARQFMPDQAHHSEILDGIAAMIDERLGREEGTIVTLMPKEGEPWSPHNSPTPYYAAKKGKVHKTSEPSWLVEVQLDPQMLGTGGSDPVAVLGADFCELAPPIECDTGAVVGAMQVPRSRSPLSWVVTHSFDASSGRSTLEHARAVRACGGLLFPSLAVGVVPASNFGAISLVGDVGLAIASLRPYRKRRGAWPITVYETDTWTETTKGIVTHGSHEIFQELTGDPNLEWLYKDDLWVLGPPVVFGPSGQTVPVTSTKKLRSALQRRAKLYPPHLSYPELDERRAAHFDSADAYPYLEAKANGIVPLSCFPLAIAPSKQRKVAEKWLREAGFQGDLVTVKGDLPEGYVPPGPGDRDARWDFSWDARETILAYAEERGMVATIET